MKKFLLGVVLIASMSSDAIFAQGGVASKIAAVKAGQSHQSGAACLLDTFNSTLVAMANEGQKGNVLVFKGGSNVKKTLQNIQSASCSNSQGITITTQDKLVVVQNTSANNPYMYYAWLKEGETVIARLTPSYKII